MLKAQEYIGAAPEEFLDNIPQEQRSRSIREIVLGVGAVALATLAAPQQATAQAIAPLTSPGPNSREWFRELTNNETLSGASLIAGPIPESFTISASAEGRTRTQFCRVIDGPNGTLIIEGLGPVNTPLNRQGRPVDSSDFLPLHTDNGRIIPIENYGEAVYVNGESRWQTDGRICSSAVSIIHPGRSRDELKVVTYGGDIVARFPVDTPDYCAAALNPANRDTTEISPAAGGRLFSAPEAGNLVAHSRAIQRSGDVYTYLMVRDPQTRQLQHLERSITGEGRVIWRLETPQRRFSDYNDVGILALLDRTTPGGRNVTIVVMSETGIQRPARAIVLERQADGTYAEIPFSMRSSPGAVVDTDGDGRPDQVNGTRDGSPWRANPLPRPGGRPVDYDRNGVEDAAQENCPYDYAAVPNPPASNLTQYGLRRCEPEQAWPVVRQTRGHTIRSNAEVVVQNGEILAQPGQTVYVTHTYDPREGPTPSASMPVRTPPTGNTVTVIPLNTTRLNNTPGQASFEYRPYIPGNPPSLGPVTREVLASQTSTQARNFGVVSGGRLVSESSEYIVQVGNENLALPETRDAGPVDIGESAERMNSLDVQVRADGGSDATQIGDASSVDTLHAADFGPSDAMPETDAGVVVFDAGTQQTTDTTAEIQEPKPGCGCNTVPNSMLTTDITALLSIGALAVVGGRRIASRVRKAVRSVYGLFQQ